MSIKTKNDERSASTLKKIEMFINAEVPTDVEMLRLNLTKTIIDDESLSAFISTMGFAVDRARYDDGYPITIVFKKRPADNFWLRILMDSPFSISLEKHFNFGLYKPYLDTEGI